MLAAIGCDTTTSPALTGLHQAREDTPPQAGFDRIQFVGSYPAALQQARAEGKPLLLFFQNAACVYCKQMQEEAFTCGQVVRQAERFICVQIEVAQAPALCRQFHVEVFPTVQFVSAYGSPLQRLTGMKDADTLAAQMEAALHGPQLRTAYRSQASPH